MTLDDNKKGIEVVGVSFSQDQHSSALFADVRVKIAAAEIEEEAGYRLGRSVAEALHDKLVEEISKNLPALIEKVGQQIAVAGIKAIVNDNK